MAEFDIKDISFEPQQMRLDEVVFDPPADEVNFSEQHGKAVSAPPSLTADEFDYRIERDVNQRPAGDFMLMGDLAKVVGEEIGVPDFAKGLAEAAIRIPSETLGGAAERFSITARQKIDLAPNLMKDFNLVRRVIDVSTQVAQKASVKTMALLEGTSEDQQLSAMSRAGKRIIQHGENLVKKMGVQATGEENPSQNFARVLGSGTMTVGMSLGITYMTKQPAIASVIFGEIQRENVLLERTQTGEDPKKSIERSNLAGSVEAALEFVGAGIWLKAISANSKFLRAIVPGIEEMFQEGLQQTGEELVQADIRTDSIGAKAKRVALSAAVGFILGEASSVVIESIHSQMDQPVAPEQVEQEKQAAKKLEESPKFQEEIEKLINNEVSNMNVTPDELDGFMAELKQTWAKTKEETVAKQEERKKDPLKQFELVLTQSLREKFQEVNDREAELKVLSEEEKTLNQIIPQLEKIDQKLSDKEVVKEANKNDFNITFQNKKQVSDFLEQLKSNRQEIRKQRENIRFKFKKRLESTDVKQAVARVMQGARRGGVIKKQQILDIQKQVRQLVEESGLDRTLKDRLLRGIENVNTITKKQKRLEALQEKIVEIEQEIQKRNLISEFRDLTKQTKIKTLSAEFRGPVEDIASAFDPSRLTEGKVRDLSSLLAALENDANNKIPAKRLNELNRLSRKSLRDMSLEDIQSLVDTLNHAYHLSSTKQRLILEKGERSLEDFKASLAAKVKEKTGVDIDQEFPGEAEQVRRGFADIKRKAFKLFDETRKVEFMLDQINAGDVFQILRKGYSNKVAQQDKTWKRVEKAFSLIKAKPKKLRIETREIEGVKNRYPDGKGGFQKGYTQEQLITIVLNSESSGNLQRLNLGWGFTSQEIEIIRNEVLSDPNMKAFVDEVFDILDSLWPSISKATQSLTGLTPVKVDGRYFPIKVDSKMARTINRQEIDIDLNSRMYEAIQFKDSFSKERIGGADPVSLLGFNTFLSHIDDAVHYANMAVPVDNIQKILKDPQIDAYFQSLLGENFRQEANSMLMDVANPRRLAPQEMIESAVNGLRHMTSMFFLGYSISVSAVQGSSFLLTPGKIGVKYTAQGVQSVFRGKDRAIDFIHERSPIIANRSENIIRDINDFLSGDQIKDLLGKGKNGILSEQMAYSMLRTIDMAVVYPTWMGAYMQGIDSKESGGLGMTEDEAALYADKIVETTQPTSALQNLPRMMRGGGFKKLFVPFMSFFTNVHNQLVNAGLETQYDKGIKAKTSRLTNALAWYWIAPAILSTFLRNLGQGDWDDYKNDILSWPWMGMVFARDIASGLFGDFPMFHPPAFTGFNKIQKVNQLLQAEDPDYFKIAVEAAEAGAFFGKIPRQLITTGSGIIEHMMGETDDFRRFFFTEGRIKYGFDKGRKKKNISGSLKRLGIE